LRRSAASAVSFIEPSMAASGNQLRLNIWSSRNIETRTTISLLTEGLKLMEIAESRQPTIGANKSGDAERAARVAREHQDQFERLPGPRHLR
jgi:DNA-binding GntR family transcriptional regulator